MDFLWSSTAKDLRRYRRDPVAFALWIGIPLLIGLLITVAFGGQGGPRPKVRLLVADGDESFLSGLLIGAMSQDAMGGLIEAEEVDEAAGRARMDKGEASALLLIPPGFSEAVLREDPAALKLITNPSQSVLPGIAEEVVSLFVDASFYLQRFIGEDLKGLAAGPPEGLNTFPDEKIAEFSVKVNRLVSGAGDYLSPLAIQLETTSGETEAEETTSVAMLFVPGLLFMALLFAAQGLSADLWQEREQKTLRRVVVGPRDVTQFLLGKVLAGGAVMFAMSAITFIVAYPYFGLDWRFFPLAVSWATFSGAFLLIAMMLIQLCVGSQRAGNVLTMTLVFPLIMIGGSFFPFEAMPGWMVSIGELTPNGWALQQLKAILSQRAELASLIPAFAGLLVVALVLFLVGARRLRTSFAKG